MLTKKLMIVIRRRPMLKPSEREKLQDCLMLVESARNILCGFEWPWVVEVNECFDSANEKITTLLRA